MFGKGTCPSLCPLTLAVPLHFLPRSFLSSLFQRRRRPIQVPQLSRSRLQTAFKLPSCHDQGCSRRSSCPVVTIEVADGVLASPFALFAAVVVALSRSRLQTALTVASADRDVHQRVWLSPSKREKRSFTIKSISSQQFRVSNNEINSTPRRKITSSGRFQDCRRAR